MNKETQKVLKHIDNNPDIQKKLGELSKKYNNFRDFYNQTGYIVMDIVNKNKQFYNLNRNKLEIDIISERYFG